MLCRLAFVFITVALVSCSAPNQGYIARGSEYGYGTRNGNSRPYRSDGRIVASTRSDAPYYQGSGSRYDRSPYGGGSTSRSYRNANPMSYGYPGYGYPGNGRGGYGYPGYGRW